MDDNGREKTWMSTLQKARGPERARCVGLSGMTSSLDFGLRGDDRIESK
jgi:hypothetical protein